jgi:hypothetical protein
MQNTVKNMAKAKMSALIIFSLALLIFIAASTAAFASAADVSVIEAPHVRVVIDGSTGKYTDTPIEINSRILLPFREILTKLGVPNDDEHIIWNEEEESVTVWDGENEIKLVIGDSVMLLNGEAINFDVAPYFYAQNNRTYVPVRAVSELLDKLVMWEEATNSVFIRNKQNYADTVGILELMQAAGAQTKIDAVGNSKVEVSISTDGEPIPGANSDGVLVTAMDMEQNIQADLDENVLFVSQTLNYMGLHFNSDVYMVGNKIFTKLDAPDSEWIDVSLQGPGDIGSALEQAQMIASQLEARDLEDVAMGLSAVKGSDGSYSIIGELINITDLNSVLGSLTGLIPEAGDLEMTMKINQYQLAESFDSDFNPIRAVIAMNISMSFRAKDDDGNSIMLYIDMDMNTAIDYNIIDPDFEIVIPDDIQKLL